MYRVKRVHGNTIYFLRNSLGEHPPRGMIQNEHLDNTLNWVFVPSDYAMPRNASTYRFTHEGRRSETRKECEKCDAMTNWVVMISDRPAYWCGCGN